VYVKEGVVFREEQAAAYPQIDPAIPDFNPRGCQKGACFSRRMYDASRVRYPLKRTGARGEGRWTRISWEQALREIADTTIDAITAGGPGSVVWDEGSGGSNLALQRTNHILDTRVLDLNGEFGDHHPGAAVTCGKISFASSADDLFHSDVILIWGGNPVYTQIPQAHFINEARYNGARVVTIAPDYNASAIHADRWIPVAIGSDAALGLSVAHVMVEEGMYDAGFITEQTDLPLLVRGDTRRLLRARDLTQGGDEETFYVFDRVTQAIREASKAHLALGDTVPALDGEFRVSTTDGDVMVTPVFALLRKQLSEYSPTATARITGVAPKVVRDLAREIATARAATVLTQSNFSKYYHGLEMERAQILVLALAGQIGRKGSGITGFPFLSLAGIEGLVVAPGSLPPKLALVALGVKAAPEMLRMKWNRYTEEMMLYEMARRMYAGGGFPAAGLFMYYHGGLDALYGRSRQWDPWMKRELSEYLAEAVEKGWQCGPGERPRILFEVGGNLLRRIKGYPRMIEELLPKLDLVVTVDWRTSHTALHSDYVLPAAAWYESDEVPWTTPISPFAHATTRVVEPLGEARSDWEFQCLFMKAVQERAIERGIRTFKDRAGEDRRLDRVYDDLTFGRRYTERNPEGFLEELLSIATNLDGISWSELKQKGFARYTAVGTGYLNLGNATDIEPDATITANTWHTEKKRPWPTLTRRMQFYIDHEFYLELGEELPIHKDMPAIGGDYPLQMTSGHTRWSIHAAWRDDANLLRLQRGGPVVFIGPGDARAREIEDGDRVRVHNDVDAFELRARVSPAVRPGQVIVYHAWEPFQFTGHKSQQALTPNPINPIQLAGGYFHLQPRLAVGTPGASDRGTRVDVERLQRQT
jgi:DMSO reductase family type II enzyme molybdopterin subunit